VSYANRVLASNALGGTATYPYPVPPQRDRYGNSWCPICPGHSIAFEVRPRQSRCFGCGQQIDWSSWTDRLSAAELLVHYERNGCRRAAPCYRCRDQATDLPR